MDQQISEIKDTVVEFITNIEKRIDDICTDTDINGKFDRIADLLDDLQALSEGINVLNDYYKKIDLMELMEKLDMLKRALDESDNLLLDDIMRYELKDLLSYWKQIL
jgi:hypothetical protein